MAAKGPKPQSTNLRLIRGNPARRPLPTSELRPPAELPPCPKHLQGEARKLYRKLGKQLVELGVMTALDRGVLSIYCSCYTRHVEAELERKRWPAASAEAKLLSRISAQQATLAYRIGADFGLNPGARHRPALVDRPLPKTAEPSAWAQFDTERTQK